MEEMDTDIFREVRKKGKRWCIPVRYVVTFLGFLGFFNINAMKVNLSVALVAMTDGTTEVNLSRFNNTEECWDLSAPTPAIFSNGSERYNWDIKTQAAILGAFFYGTTLSQIPGGIVAVKFGSKWLFAGGVVVTAILTVLTPLAAGWGASVLIAVRVLEGIGEGLMHPSSNALVSRWAPKFERSMMSTIFYTGCDMGNLVAMPLSGFLCSSELLGGWPSAFYTFGIFAFLWFPFWMYFVTDKPEDHPHITYEELYYIQDDQRKENLQKNLPIPWKNIFTSIPMWALTLTHFGFAFGFFIVLTEFPSYLNKVLHFDIKSDGILSALPSLMQALCAWTSSYFADKIRKLDLLKITTIRKLFNSVGLLGPAACLFAITLLGCRPKLIVGLVCLSMAFSGFCCAGYNVTHIDMSPEFSGTLYGITNTAANACGILAPAVVGILTSQENSLRSWNHVFYITTGIYMISALIFICFGSAELQLWSPGDQSNLKSDLKETTGESKNTQIVPCTILKPM